MKAGFLQLPPSLATPMFAAAKVFGKAEGVCVCGMQPAYSGPWRPAAQAAGLNGRQGAATRRELRPRTCGHCQGDLANPFHSAPRKSPGSETDRQLWASFCEWPGRVNQTDLTLPRLLLRPPHSGNWNPGDKVPSPLLGECFPDVSGKHFFLMGNFSYVQQENSVLKFPVPITQIYQYSTILFIYPLTFCFYWNILKQILTSCITRK